MESTPLLPFCLSVFTHRRFIIMTLELTDKIIIIDIEATCWEDSSFYQKRLSEIIEIGICVLDIDTGMIEANKGLLVKPVNSEISPFCTKLTSITPAMIEKDGISLKQAIAILKEQYSSKNFTWASYGAYDKSMLKEQCQKFNIDYPMSSNHINVKVLLSEKLGLHKGVGMNTALKMLKMPLEGTHHRGVDDAYNIAKILNWILKN